MYPRSRSRNEPLLWGGKPNVGRFARQSIAHWLVADQLSCWRADPAWARLDWRWKWRRTRGALASDAPSGTATKETNLFPFSPSSRWRKAVWRTRQASMISADGWGKMRPN